MTFRSGLLNAKNKLLIEGEVITKRLPILLRLIKKNYCPVKIFRSIATLWLPQAGMIVI